MPQKLGRRQRGAQITNQIAPRGGTYCAETAAWFPSRIRADSGYLRGARGAMDVLRKICRWVRVWRQGPCRSLARREGQSCALEEPCPVSKSLLRVCSGLRQLPLLLLFFLGGGCCWEISIKQNTKGASGTKEMRPNWAGAHRDVSQRAIPVHRRVAVKL